MAANYIRFFISSTFADMERERNILNDVLNGLQREYEKEGWIIEWTDLRWGISREAALDNRTMRICLEELQRCRRLSPRPNFIVLVGERYGWVPLPEVIPYLDIDKKALYQLSPKYSDIFEYWYKLDANALPNGEYILMPREGVYEDDDIYQEQVVSVLQRVLTLICTGETAGKLSLSATAHEIYTGLDENTADYTFIYKRQLLGIPHEEKDVFCKDAIDKQEGIRLVESHLNCFTNQSNLLPIKGNFADYISGKLDPEIRLGMHRRLSAIIQKTVEERKRLIDITENQRHIMLAAEHEGELFGRDDEIAMLFDYISSEDRRPLLLISDSGVGKSAVMIELINRLASRDDIALVARLCGETIESSEPWSFMEGVANDIHKHTPIYKRQLRHGRKNRVRLARGAGFSEIGAMNIWDIFKQKVDSPVVVILDAIDAIDDSKAKGFFDLDWLKVTLPENLKVVVSCIPSKINYSLNRKKIRYEQLHNLDQQAMPVLEHLIRLKNRRLSIQQTNDVRKIVESSDCSGIYLKVLADFLAMQSSWVDVSSLPSDLDCLLDCMFNSMRLDNRHGKRLVNLCLMLLKTTRLGLSDTEIKNILSIDDVLVEEVKRQSCHKMTQGIPDVPPIFWTRLQADLGNLVKQRYTLVGLQNVFAHSRIMDYVTRRMNDDFELKYTATIDAFNYFSRLVVYRNLHALYECPRLLYEAVTLAGRLSKNNDLWADRHNKCLSELSALLFFGDFIFGKALSFKNDLIQDYTDFVAPLKNMPIANYLAQIRNEIIELPDAQDVDSLISYAQNMPDSYNLSALAAASNSKHNKLKNSWRNLLEKKSIINAVPLNSFNYGCQISLDGNNIAILADHGNVLQIDRLLTSRNDSIRIPLNDRAYTLSSDGTLSSHVVSFTDCVKYIRVSPRRVLKYTVKQGHGYLSVDGRFLVIVHQNEFMRYNIETGEQRNYNYNSDIVSSAVDSAGRFLWLSLENGDECRIVRFDLENDKTLGFGKGGFIILFVTDEVCVVRSEDELYIKAHVNLNGKDTYREFTCAINGVIDFGAIWYDEIARSLYVDFETSLHEFRLWEDKDFEINHGRQPRLGTVRGRYALRYKPLAIVDWRKMLDEINVLTGFNVGINSFSATDDGSMAVMAFGINQLQEVYKKIIIATDNGILKKTLPFTDNNYVIVTSVAVSPDGRHIAASSNSGEIILVKTDDMTLVNSVKFDGDYGCLGISFSSDSRKFLAVSDHFFSHPNPTIHIGDVVTGEIYIAPGQPDWTTKENAPWMPWPQGNSRFIGNDRFALLGGFYLWDIVGCCEVIPKNNSIPYHETLLHVGDNGNISRSPRACIFEHPHNGCLFSADKGVMTMIDPYAGTQKQTTVNLRMIGLNVDGTQMFFINSDNDLIISNVDGEYEIARDIVAVYPSKVKSDEFYAYTTEAYVVRMDVSGQEYCRTYVPDLWHAIPTARGLAVATPRGPMMLL